jgi:hypothetical protein
MKQKEKERLLINILKLFGPKSEKEVLKRLRQITPLIAKLK